MHSKSVNIEIMINYKPEEVIKELFQPLLSRYQIGLETSVKGGEFFFDYVCSLYYKCRKINGNCGKSHIDSPDLIKNKKAIKHSINKEGDICFQYTMTIALNLEETRKNPWKNKN